MHEESLVRSVLSEVQQLASANVASSVEVVTVDIGLLSGVEPELFRLAFERLAPASLGADCRLQLRCTPMLIRCRDCDAECEMEETQFVCAACSSPNVEVRGGDRVILDSVEVTTGPDV
jgi:hydrogenase nickel incorporation protein HypA/HybF